MDQAAVVFLVPILKAGSADRRYKNDEAEGNLFCC